MKQPLVGSASVVALLLFPMLLLPQGESAHAQIVARVAAQEHVTERKSAEVAPWVKAKIGTTLEVDNRFRTRKRSKADILFADKSLIRLGALSTLFVQNATDTKLTEGELLFSRLTPGRVVAGAGIAGIKGSVGTIHINEDGSTLFSLITGAMDVDTISGEHVSLLPGQAVLVSATGALSALRVAAPLISSGSGTYGPGTGGGGSGLGQAPVDSPYAGSPTNIGVRSAPDRVAADQGNTSSNSVVAENANPFDQQQTVRGLPVTPPIEIFPSQILTHVSPLLANQNALQAASVSDAAPGALTEMAPVLSDLDTGPAETHIGGALDYAQSTGYADFEAIGALGDGGTQAYGGRLHTFLHEGPWSLDASLLPLKLRYNSPVGRVSRDISSLSTASLTYSSPVAEVEVGRQRFLAGPTQAALFGSMVRQGARDTMDAVRISPNIGQRRHLDLAYLYDAFPRNLPYRVAGRQQGYYGRFGMQTPHLNYGLNLLHYSNLAPAKTTGITADFAIPLKADEIEFYGEVGQDPFRRGVVTTGLTFPGLYDRTDFDVYLECAAMQKRGSTASVPPTEYAMRVYRRINKNSNLVIQLQKFHRSESSVTIGFSYGGRAYLPGG